MKTLLLILLCSISLYSQSDYYYYNQPVRVVTGSFEPEVVAYDAALTTPLTSTYKDTLDLLVKMLKDSLGLTKGASNLNTIFDRFWIFANQSTTAARKDIITLSNVTPVNSPTFNAYRGYTGNGSSSYINSNFNPTTNNVTFTQNSASVSIVTGTDVNEIRWEIGSFSGTGASATNLITLASRYSNNTYGDVNSSAVASEISFANTNAIGHYSISRTGANEVAIYKNGASKNTGTGASGAAYNGNLFILCVNNDGTPNLYSTKQIRIVLLGKGFNATEIRKIHNSIEWFLDAIGAGVQ